MNRMESKMRRFSFLLVAALALLTSVSHGDDGEKVLTIDHDVRVKSTVQAIALRASSSNDHVVLFVHGAGTPDDDE
jgi:hypothetical protein